MRSMTGYAYRETADSGSVFSAEIHGYNSRFLELSVNLPSWLSGVETKVREYAQGRFVRGKIDIAIRIKEGNSPLSVKVNAEAARAYAAAFADIARALGLDEKPPLPLILNMEGVIETERNRDCDHYWTLIEPLLAAAADGFEAERIREGKHTEEDILSHVAILEKNCAAIAAHAPVLEQGIKENIRRRFEEVFEGKYGIDENRVLAETAVLLVKYSINEELSRLDSHLAEFRAETARNESPGKKLDFLCQEINREINTIGSKTPVTEVSRAVVEMKDALENIREQLKNVE